MEFGRDAWETTASRRWPRPALSGRRHWTAGGGEKQRSREVGDEVWTDLQFPKSLEALLENKNIS